nr:long-chain-fatty-acid--CoA ligase [Shiraia sp. slf14]
MLATLFAFAICTVAVWCNDWDPVNWRWLAIAPEEIPHLERYGNDYWCALRGSDRAAGIQMGDTRTPPTAESVFIRRPDGDRPRWNWHEIWAGHMVDAFDSAGWTQVMTDLNKDVRDPNWSFVMFIHGDPKDPRPCHMQTYRTGNPEPNAVWPEATRKSTCAMIQFAFNRNYNIIVLTHWWSPKNAAHTNWPDLGDEQPIHVSHLPQLRHISDLVWEPWIKARAYGVPRIDFFAWSDIQEPLLFGIMATILIQRGLPEPELWPAMNSVVLMDSSEGRAMLGTSTGKAVAFFLIQHKKRWNRPQHIESFTFFRGPTIDGKYKIQLIFKITPVPENMEHKDPNPPGPLPVPYPPALFPIARSVPTDHTNRTKNGMLVESQGPKNFMRVHKVHM